MNGERHYCISLNQMYWLLLGGTVSFATALLWRTTLELITLALGIECAEIPVSRKSAAYARLIASSWGLGYTYIDGNGRFRYGMFLAPRLGILGWVTPLVEDQSSIHVWAFRASAIDALMKRDPEASTQYLFCCSKLSTFSAMHVAELFSFGNSMQE